MEAEKAENGPLKNNEISRFLEASKASYNAVDSVLGKRKEKSFQQRTLLEIASETEMRTKNLVVDGENVKSQNIQNSENSPEMVLEEEQSSLVKEEADKLEAEAQEAARLAAEKKALEDQEAIRQKEKAIFDEGFAAGKVALGEESEKKLATCLLALDNARKSILDLNATHFIKLRDAISYSILKLASERIGKSIEDSPEAFIQKIEALIESMGEKTKSPIIYLNPLDLSNIKETVADNFSELGLLLKGREDLMHGDVIIEIGSISLSDLLTDRAKTLLTTEYHQQQDETHAAQKNSNTLTENSVDENDQEQVQLEKNDIVEGQNKIPFEKVDPSTKEPKLTEPSDIMEDETKIDPQEVEVGETKSTDPELDNGEIEITGEDDTKESKDGKEEEILESEDTNTDRNGET